jgi:hypothetical protein
MTAAEVLIKALDKEMKPTLGLNPASNEQEWLNPKNDRSYLVRKPIRLAHHFDIEPAFLIRDSALGTLGIVEIVLPGDGAIATQVRRHVDTATYARHLLLRDYLRGDETALTVELCCSR